MAFGTYRAIFSRNNLDLLLSAMQAVGVAARRVVGARSAAQRLSQSAARTYATPVPFLREEKDPQLGDYPDLPYESKQRRNARGWDDPQMRRNFGEPVSDLTRYSES
jgi:NADH dehydrogenase (ubiquinone) 1 beta subcomplex subunit 8